ncbi:hypothetical protein ADUPG1_003669, partial [Aduncisulcus paluster]
RRISSSSSPISPSFSSSPSSSSPGSILPKLNATQVYKLCGAAMCCLLTWDAAICGDGHEIKYNGTHLSLKDMFIVAAQDVQRAQGKRRTRVNPQFPDISIIGTSEKEEEDDLTNSSMSAP